MNETRSYDVEENSHVLKKIEKKKEKEFHDFRE